MTTTRITITVVRSGQPRAYADTERVVKVTFERDDWRKPSETNLGAMYLNAKVAEEYISQLPLSGYVATREKDRSHGLEPYLDYLKPVNPVAISHAEEVTASIWEFRVVSPYCD